MTVQPLKNIVYLKIEEVEVGVLNTSSVNTAMEIAEVIAVGEWVDKLKVGDKLFVKSWAIDIITYQDQKYYFVNIESGGILAVITD